VDGPLSDFLDERAVDKLSLSIEREEAKARADYKTIGNGVVTKLFDYYSKYKS
jgi:hypothetical protein